MSGLKNILAWIRRHYDKLAAFLVLVGLLVSVLYLALRVGMFHVMQDEWDATMGKLKPTYPKAAAVDVSGYEKCTKEIGEPSQIPQWTNFSLLVAGERVICPECRLPIPFEADICPFSFCKAKQPEDKTKKAGWDSDRDLMPDEWEIKYGLDPNNPEDAGLDKDKDGFTNLEEYEAQPESTSPTDAKSHPPYALKLLVEKVVVDPFLLRFKAVITMPDGSLVFQLNLRGDRKTHFVKMNEVVEGFKLMKYEEKRVKQRTSGFRGEREVDVSEVTLQRGDKAGDKVIVLVKGKEEVWSDYSVVLYFTVDKKRFDPVKKDSVVTLRDEKYVVISIDSKEQSVVIRREDDGKEFTIRKTPEKEEEKSPRGEPTSIPGDQGENRQ